MRTKNLATLAFVLVTTSVVAAGCGSDAAPPAVTDAGGKPDAGLADAEAATLLAISPLTPTAKGCSTDKVTFTASGGTPPYIAPTTYSSSASSSASGEF